MLCDGCDECCRYIALQIDKPKTEEDYDHILWFLLHENVHVYVDWEDDWLLEFATPCKMLDKKTRLCTIYNRRPQICRSHRQSECVRHDPVPAEKLSFRSADEFKKYWKDRKEKKNK